MQPQGRIWTPPSETVLRRIVDQAGRGYFADRRARIDGFVDRHFTFGGSLRVHRRALGRDLLRAPANVLLAVPNVLIKLGGVTAQGLGARVTGRWLLTRRILFETDVGREVEWLIMTDLLELPYAQGERASRRDALAEAILGTPEIEAVMAEALAAVGRRADDPAFRREVEEALTTYAGTRAAAAEITTALLALGTGVVAMQKATPGMFTLGPALAAAVAQQSAIASFPLGASLGSLWYGAFPAAASPALVAGMTGGLLAVGAVAAAVAGVVADPIQRRMGLHHRRLRRLVDALERHIRYGSEGDFAVRDHYVARLLDLFDVLGSAYRLTRI